MKIDRSNYEIWLIDWLDGNLSDLQIEEVKLFLNNNPELRQEFDDLSALNLKPPVKSFSNKDHLKKSISALSGSQFDYLCVAYLENDLNTRQHSELKEILDQCPEKKKDFELIQKLRLAPGIISYKHKNQLIKRTSVQNVIRLSVIGLSIAATIALFIITYFLFPVDISVINNNSSQNIVIDSNLQKTNPEVVPENLTIEKKAALTKEQSGNLITEVLKIVPLTDEPGKFESQQDDTLLKNTEYPVLKVNKVYVLAEINLNAISVSNTLIAFNPPVIISSYDDGRSKLSRFIAKNFREKILKENTSKDSPLKAYEIAEAGVNGLNRLFGWEMALDERNDENGELKSVYFSSKILKFNAPVKKTRQLQ